MSPRRIWRLAGKCSKARWEKPSPSAPSKSRFCPCRWNFLRRKSNRSRLRKKFWEAGQSSNFLSIFGVASQDKIPVGGATRSSSRQATPAFFKLVPSLLLRSTRSEEHTSELQSPCNLVCRLLLEKKK